MIATIVNSISIIIGSLIGLTFRKLIRQEVFTSILKVLGIIIIVIGLSGILTSMLTVEKGIIKSHHEVLYLIVLIAGGLIGEILKLDNHFNNLVNKVETQFKGSSFSQGFLNASVLFCVGTMAIIGSIEASSGHYQIIFLKAALDGITSIILASTLGLGVLFSAFSVLFYQTVITILAYFTFQFDILSPFSQVFNMVGYTIILCLGLNFYIKDKIKVINMIPSLILVIIYFFLKSLIY